MPLLCDRPHPAAVDYETSRFVVNTASGLLGPVLLETGDEIPRGMFDQRTLRCLYDLHRIEVFSYAAQLPDLREACARRGVVLDQEQESPPASQPGKPSRVRKQKA